MVGGTVGGTVWGMVGGRGGGRSFGWRETEEGVGGEGAAISMKTPQRPSTGTVRGAGAAALTPNRRPRTAVGAGGGTTPLARRIFQLSHASVSAHEINVPATVNDAQATQSQQQRGSSRRDSLTEEFRKMAEPQGKESTAWETMVGEARGHGRDVVRAASTDDGFERLESFASGRSKRGRKGYPPHVSLTPVDPIHHHHHHEEDHGHEKHAPVRPGVAGAGGGDGGDGWGGHDHRQHGQHHHVSGHAPHAPPRQGLGRPATAHAAGVHHQVAAACSHHMAPGRMPEHARQSPRTVGFGVRVTGHAGVHEPATATSTPNQPTP
ncbi:hypothetical protein T484DRAFT_1882036 [Baffinella frigidus]|nr:hypothetical protein T484DRAFT_1882036 [Cryptophyta sp. CCMP2293]